GQRLVAEDRLADQIPAGDHRREVEPRVDDRDIPAVGMEGFFDWVTHQHAIRRSDVRAGSRRTPTDEHANPERVRAIGKLPWEAWNMRDDPAQVADRDFLVSRLAGLDELSGVLQAQRMIFATPPRFRDGAKA